MGVFADSWPKPTRSVAEDDAFVPGSARWQDPETVTTATTEVLKAARAIRPRKCSARPSVIHLLYFLFIGGSSMKLTQNPLGLTLVAFFTILIFILIS